MNKMYDINNMNDIYDIFINYFDNPLFTKIKDTDDYSIYMCKLNIYLANTHRYLISIVDRDVYFKGNQVRLSKLNWKVFQTRSLVENHNIEKQTYQPKKIYPFNIEINLSSQDELSCNYECKDIQNLNITLIKNKNNLYDYPQKGTLNSALETYNAIVVI